MRIGCTLVLMAFILALPLSGTASDADDIASVLSEQSFDVRDRLAILNLLHVYSHAADGLHLELFGKLFTEDAQFTVVPRGADPAAAARPMGRGRAAIVAGLVERHRVFRKTGTQRRHFLTNPVVWNQTETGADVGVYLQLRSSKKGGSSELVSTGRYRGRVEKTAAGWRIADWKVFVDQELD